MSDAKNINEVTQITTVESADYLMISDISDASLKRATVEVVGETLLGTTDISGCSDDGTVTGGILAACDGVDELEEDVTLLSTTTATSESFALTDTSEGNALAHTLYGMSVQDGTPTPSSPVDIESSVANFTCANSDSTESVTITTDLTLRAIEVTSSDDYNLVRDDKYYIADTVDWSEDDGYVLTRRIGNCTLLSSGNWVVTDLGYTGQRYTLNDSLSANTGILICSHFAIGVDWRDTWGYIRIAGVLVVVGDGGSTHQFASLDDFKTWLASNPVTVDYVLATPTTEHLTAEQAEALLSLKTYDTATSIVCTADVAPTMELEYASGRVTALALTGHNESAGNSALFRCNQTTAGTYTLQAVVDASGTVTYSWV